MRRTRRGTLLRSQGTPMGLMGDELGRSQAGDNNAYCQDNDLSWLQWDKVSDRDRAFRDFVEGLIRVRRTWSTLRRSSFVHGQQVGGSGIENVIWLKPDGARMDDKAWEDPLARSIALLMCSPALDRSLLLLNADRKSHSLNSSH